MAPNFISPDRDQSFLFPPSLRDWLPESDYVWFIIDTVQRFDIAPFLVDVRLDGKGGALYDPRMMLTLMIYAYSMGTRSSRRIEQLCERDIAFRLICANLKPDHTSIARFRQRHEQAIAGVFRDVLIICREAKMTKAGVIAIDGTKLAGNTSLGANRTEVGLEEEIARILGEAKAKDAEEDGLFGEKRGDELPPDLQTAQDRKRRIDECLEQVRRKKAAEQAKKDEMARRREEAEAAGKKLRGRKPKEKAPDKEPKANVTDPESRTMKNPKGFLQGYNAQAAATKDQIIVAAEVTQDQNDQHQLHPMVEKVIDNLKAAGEKKLPKVALADAGYANETDLGKPLPEGVEGVVATLKSSQERSLNSPAPKGRISKKASATERMARKTRTKRGKALYKLRGQIIEPVFGQLKSGQQKLDRFSRRGRDACDSEWKLICAVHNLRKLWNIGRRKQEKKDAIH
jgi:transposase